MDRPRPDDPDSLRVTDQYLCNFPLPVFRAKTKAAANFAAAFQQE
jgi:hypothetical protein